MTELHSAVGHVQFNMPGGEADLSPGIKLGGALKKGFEGGLKRQGENEKAHIKIRKEAEGRAVARDRVAAAEEKAAASEAARKQKETDKANKLRAKKAAATRKARAKQRAIDDLEASSKESASKHITEAAFKKMGYKSWTEANKDLESRINTKARGEFYTSKKRQAIAAARNKAAAPAVPAGEKAPKNTPGSKTPPVKTTPPPKGPRAPRKTPDLPKG